MPNRQEKFGRFLDKVNRVFSGLDGYGESYKGDPSFGQKTWVGGLIWLLFKFVMLFLFCYNLVRLLQGGTLTRDGKLMVWNTETVPVDKNGKDLETGKLPILDVPPLNIIASTDLYMFESKSPSVQRIRVVDNTRFQPILDSADLEHNQRFPRARAVYGTTTVPLDRFFQSNMSTLIKSQQSHEFASTELLYYLDNPTFKRDDSFFPHDFYAYFRVDPDGLGSIKPCQLQLWAANVGEYKAVKDEVMGQYPSTAQEDLLDYNFGVQYATNFRVIKQGYDDSADGDAFSSYRWAAKAAAPAENMIDFVGADAGAAKATLSPPFFVELSNINGVETVQVEQVIQTPGAPDRWQFARIASASATEHHVNFTLARAQLVLPKVAPPDWVCPEVWYGSHDGCDCSCGAYDPDCEEPAMPVYHCYSSGSKCNRQANCVARLGPETDVRHHPAIRPSPPTPSRVLPPQAAITTRWGRNPQRVFSPEQMFVSDPFDQSRLHTFGDSYVRNFVGQENLSRASCAPGTTSWGQAILSDYIYRCYGAPVSWIESGKSALPECGGTGQPVCDFSLVLNYDARDLLREHIPVARPPLPKHPPKHRQQHNLPPPRPAPFNPLLLPWLPRCPVLTAVELGCWGKGARLFPRGAELTTLSPRMQRVRLASLPAKNHAVVGWLSGPFNSRLADVLISHDTSVGDPPFEAVGPYYLLINGTVRATVISAELSPVPSLQRMRLDNIKMPNASVTWGAQGILTADVPRDDVGGAPFNVSVNNHMETFSPSHVDDGYYDCALVPPGQSTPPPSRQTRHLPTIFWGSMTSIPPRWHCSAAQWGDGICDCLCGEWDIDCFRLAPNATRLSPQCTDPELKYCVYPGFCGDQDMGDGLLVQTIALSKEHGDLAKGTTVACREHPVEKYWQYVETTTHVQVPGGGGEDADIGGDVWAMICVALGGGGGDVLVGTGRLPPLPLRPFEQHDDADLDRGSVAAFLPMDRAKNTGVETWSSPASIGVTFAGFIVPKSPLFDEVDLRPKETQATGADRNVWADYEGCGFANWVLDPQRRHIVEEYSMEKFDGSVCQSAATTTETPLSTKGCITQMPPTRKVHMTYQHPLTSKWHVASEKDKRCTLGQLPEYRVSFSTEYYLTFDSTVQEAEKMFAQGIPSNGDTDSEGHAHFFNGMARVMESDSAYPMPNQRIESPPGLPHSTPIPCTPCTPCPTSASRPMRPMPNQRIESPAHTPSDPCSLPPIASSTLTPAQPSPGHAAAGLDASDVERDGQLPQRHPRQEPHAPNWPTKDDEIAALAARLPKLNLQWVLEPLGGVSENQTLVLQPGLEYTLSATLALRAVREAKNPLAQLTSGYPDVLTSWSLSIQSQSASVRTLDAFGSNKATVTYILNFDPSIKAQIIDLAFTLQDFFNSLVQAEGRPRDGAHPGRGRGGVRPPSRFEADILLATAQAQPVTPYMPPSAATMSPVGSPRGGAMYTNPVGAMGRGTYATGTARAGPTPPIAGSSSPLGQRV
ncbi:hypothetical protein PAPYR_1766 [Paratrimastix pyriformis]|uniref:Uncharacterized protein n=1 Tax=Paratrimastix pyriformis TaxID=342808 RepID=A0ABQ8UR90_9EUKA|nr:hypothetical protein PAPYR_1766 [Paratrimastix pyriformis]